MYYKDLSNYQYNLPFEIDHVKNIGWLEFNYPYIKGEVPNGFLNKLFKIIKLKEVNLMRGLHDCDICNSDGFKYIYHNNEEILLGHAEIWIPSINHNFIYASPTLIYHYIEKHNYLPPQDFIDSVMAFDLDSDWDGGKILLSLKNGI